MKKNIFDRLSDSFERFHFKDSHIGKGNDILYISPKLKITFGWSLFVLCFVVAYIYLGNPFFEKPVKEVSKEQKQEVMDEKVNVNEEHDTIVPYEKDSDEELNTFVGQYFQAMTSCDHLKMQDMVTDPTKYKDDVELKRKAEFITAYDNITVYSKAGPDEGGLVVFVVANLSITGVNSSPYDIMTLYIVNGARGYRVNNGNLSQEVKDYIVKIKGDADIQKVYKSVEQKNEELKESDPTLREFYEIISRRNVQTQSGAEQESAATQETDGNEETETIENQE